MAQCGLRNLLAFLQANPEILLSTACFFLLAYHRSHRSSVLPVNWPIIGMLPALLANLHRFHDWSTDILREAGCTFLFRGPWFSGMDVLSTADPANASHIFNINFPNYPKGPEFSELFDILGNGIFNSDAEQWRSQRRQAHILMADRKFRTFTAICSRDKVEKGLLPVLTCLANQEEVVDLQDVFLRLTFDLTCNLVFGVDTGCLTASGFPTVPFAKAMDDANSALALRHATPSIWWKLLRWLRIGEEKKLAMAWEVMDQFIADAISKKRSSKNSEAQAADLLTSYIEHSAANDDKFLRDTTMNFLLAGRDTTGAALSWFFWLLINNPEAETRILEELKACSRLSSIGLAVFDPDRISSLVYLHAAICEALRLYPPVPFQHKAVARNEALPNGMAARTDTKLLISVYAMGRMEGVWGKDCMEFRPERWISEHGKRRYEPAYKFLSFNCGPRTCLGRDIAFTQMKTVVAAIVYNFQIEWVGEPAVEPKLSTILHMKRGLMVKVRKRGNGW